MLKQKKKEVGNHRSRASVPNLRFVDLLIMKGSAYNCRLCRMCELCGKMLGTALQWMIKAMHAFSRAFQWSLIVISWHSERGMITPGGHVLLGSTYIQFQGRRCYLLPYSVVLCLLCCSFSRPEAYTTLHILYYHHNYALTATTPKQASGERETMWQTKMQKK